MKISSKHYVLLDIGFRDGYVKIGPTIKMPQKKISSARIFLSSYAVGQVHVPCGLFT